MPNDVVGQTNDLVAGTLGHLGETLGFGLVLEGVRGEVDACRRLENSLSNRSSSRTCAVHIGLDEDVDATNAVKLHLLVLVLPPVSHADQVCAAGVVFLVTLGENGVRVQGLLQAAGLVRLDPRIVVNCQAKSADKRIDPIGLQHTATFNITAITVAVEPNICGIVSLAQGPQPEYSLGTRMSLS